ncbi:MAG: S41 family peptidase [Clostridia bacterium]|nr:S41 family peptidase [Clostridia bacterium]
MIKRIIETNYDGDIDSNKFEDYKVKGMVEALGDPHSMFLTKDEFEAFYSEVSGNYTGIGIEVYLNEQYQIEIISVFPDTPAFNAGLQVGDIIKSAGTIEATLENYSDLIRFMRGLSEEGGEGNTFTLTFERDGNEFSTEINRADINVPTVSTKEFDGIYYVKVSGFADETERDFKSSIESAEISEKKGLIIDLRDNPGGTLESVVNIADYILPEGTIVYTSDKNGKKEYFNSDKSAVDIPIVVLINENSASASEILAAALHDNNKATLIGKTTYGKGSVQNITLFPDGSALKLTVAHYYTPKGVCIDGIGINPDYEVELSDESKTKLISMLAYEEDTQLQKAVEFLTQ